MQLNFGVGTLIGKRTDTTYAKPSFLGVVQDCQMDFDVTLKELLGQYKMPVDIAPAQLKIAVKAKFARIQADTINQLMLGLTETAAAGTDMAVAEAHTNTGTTYTVTNGATFVEDLGVYYASTGIQLQPAASASGTGIYIPGAAGVGQYTFAAGDNAASLLFYYSYTVTSLINLAGVNQLMGSGPVFAFNASENYTVQGVTKKIFVKLNACRASKFSWPFKNGDYTIQDFEFQAFADTSNAWGTIALTE
jgi:hypothetical protein